MPVREPAPQPARPRESTLISPAIPLSGADSDGWHAPTLADFFPPAIVFGGTPFEIDRIMMIRLLVLGVLVVLFTIFAARTKLVPGRYTGTFELLLDFVRVQIAENILGTKDGRRFFPLLATIFFLVLGLNITGVIPALNIAGTSRIGVPLVLALIAYVTFIAVGIAAQGFLGYFKSSLFPPNVPWPLYFIVTPIEFISTFIARPFSLTIRLLANMIAGHLLLVLCFSATNYLFLESQSAVGIMGVVTLFGGFTFTLFEILVATLQAYIFALLTAVYISGSLHPEH